MTWRNRTEVCVESMSRVYDALSRASLTETINRCVCVCVCVCGGGQFRTKCKLVAMESLQLLQNNGISGYISVLSSEFEASV